MRVAFVEIENFRGIKNLEWAPAAKINCLIGPGDSTKTTVLDAIELALNPRSYIFADDSDFFDLIADDPIKITVALVGLPPEFIADNRYGMHLRGWDNQHERIEDEPREGLEYALSVRVQIDKSLEARWSIFNERIGEDSDKSEPPAMRYKDAQRVGTTRLGPYAERHLGWGRHSVLTHIGEKTDSVYLQLAEANRAAREAFRQNNENVFKDTVARAQDLGKHFAVPVRKKYGAELDVQGISITAGGIALHDGNLPLRRLGTGSSRLIVCALQHDAGGSHVALIDEIEHGLEPHRIARLLKYLKSSSGGAEEPPAPQMFITTHSPVVIRELVAADIFAVRSVAGSTTVKSVAATAKNLDTAQRHLRHSPDAFLARRVIVSEGRTEQGFLRGADTWWSSQEKDSFAVRGVTAIDGGSSSKALAIAEHLIDLGYGVSVVLDADEPTDAVTVADVKKKGGVVHEWPDACSTEERIFLDVPWDVVVALLGFAEECVGADSTRHHINAACSAKGLATLSNLAMPATLDNEQFRRALGIAAKNKNRPWFKDISRAEQVAAIVAPCLEKIRETPLAQTMTALRQWVDE